jgi:ligand-binding sensor domain-containing protein
MRRLWMIRLAFLAPMLLLVPRPAAAQTAYGAWSTYLHVASVRDLICHGDVVWMATGEAGLVRYDRADGSFNSITREPGGLASNTVQAITFDRHGNLFAAATGRGVSRLDTDGRWSLINEFDGMPSDSALAFRAQGDTVWIGTTRGLALWNGTTLAGSVPDRGTQSPFDSDIITGVAIAEDTLFVGTPVGVYHTPISPQLKWTRINAGLPTNPSVLSMATDGRTVLVVASGSGITTSLSWDAGTQQWNTDAPGTGFVRRVRDESGRLLCTTTAGIFVRRPGGPRPMPGWDHLAGSPATDNIDAAAVEVGVDSAGVAFASTRGLLFEAPPAPQVDSTWIGHTPPGPVGNKCINIAESDGSVYVGYDTEGFSRLRDGVWRNWSSSDVCTDPDPCDTTFASVGQPTGLLIDPLGIKWVGVWSGPLARIEDAVSTPLFKNITFTSSSPDTVELHSLVWSAAADSNTGARAGRWFGLDTNDRGNQKKNPIGIDVYDTSGTLRRSFQPGYPGLRNGQVRALAVDRFNTMWVGYAANGIAGLSTFPVPPAVGDSIRLEDVPDTKLIDCFGIQIYRDSVWVLATDGLHRYNRTTGLQVTRLDIAGPPAPRLAPHPLALAPDGSVFVGTTGGVRWHQRGKSPIDFTPDNSPIANIEVRAVWVEASGAVWIGTPTGINRFDPHYSPPPEPRLPSLHVTVYPNPAWRTAGGFALRLKGQATAYEGEIFDINGRLVHRFVAGGNNQVIWDGHDLDRRGVGAGVYFLRVRGGGAETTTRLVVIQ